METSTNIFNNTVILKNILKYLNAKEVKDFYQSDISSLFFIGEDKIQDFSQQNIHSSNEMINEMKMKQIRIVKDYLMIHFNFEPAPLTLWESVCGYTSRILQRCKFQNSEMIRENQNIIDVCKDKNFTKPILKCIRTAIVSCKSENITHVIYLDLMTYSSFKFLKRFYGEDILKDIQLTPCIRIMNESKTNNIADFNKFFELLNCLKMNFKTDTKLNLEDSINEIVLLCLKETPITLLELHNELWLMMIQ